MKNSFFSYGFFGLSVLVLSCSGSQTINNNPPDSTATAKKVDKQLDSLFAKESDTPEENLQQVPASDTLKNIRANFKRINGISNWTKKETRPTEQTTEGGEASYFYLDGKLEKVVTQNYGETYQQLTQYYLSDGQLSFVFEKTVRYNRPIYYDSTAMKDNNDTETFDLKKSSTLETRSYFFKDQLFYQTGRQKNEPDVINRNLKEEKVRIKTAFDELINLLSKK